MNIIIFAALAGLLTAPLTGPLTGAMAQPAQETASGWEIVRIKYMKRDGGHTMVFTAYTADASKTGVMLQCSSKTIVALISTQPLDFRTKLQTPSHRRLRTINGKLLNDGTILDERRWRFNPGQKFVRSTARKPAAKIFNAVVKGQALTFEGAHLDDPIDLNLPPIDANFRAFNSSCQAFWK